MTDIKLFKLVNGEDILAEVVDTDETGFYEVKNIAQIGLIPQRQPGASAQVGMAPWVPYRDMKAPVIFFREHIMAIMVPQEDAVTEYNRMFSPIITPSSLILTK